MKKDILIVDFNGTSPTYTYHFSMAFKQKEHNIKILGYKNKEDLRIYKDHIEYIGFNTKIRFLNYILNWGYLIFNAKKFKVIHFQWFPLLNFSSIELLFIKLLKQINPNVFYTVHNIFPHDQTNKKVIGRYKKVYKIINNLAVHTRDTKLELLKYCGDKKNIIIINHGNFFLDQVDNVTVKNENIIVMLGRILKYKGIDDALQAAEILKDQNIHFKLIIRGKSKDYNYYNLLKNKINKLNLNQYVSIENGYIDVKKLIEIYNKAKVTLMPYKKIDQSGVVFSSLGLNVPIVAYKTGGLKYAVKDKVNGRLVEKNNIYELAESIKWVLNHQEELATNIKNSKDNSHWKDSADILLRHYFNETI